MSKYKPLADFLGGHVPDTWKVSFDELETTLGVALPKAARANAAWWSNEVDGAKAHAKSWLDAGWQAAADLAGGHVTFTRGAPPLSVAPDPTAHEVMAAAEAAFEKTRAVETAKKVGIVAAVVGVVAAGIGLVATQFRGRKK